MRSGFTLVELTVALLLFTVMGLGAVHLLQRAAVAARHADVEERLLWRATAVADSLAAGLLSGSGEQVVPGVGTLRWRGGGRGRVELLRWKSDSTWVTLPVVPNGAVPVTARSR